jgi:mycothiol synthase
VNLPPGFTSRPASPEDLDDVATLLDAWQVARYGDAEASRPELQFDWGAPWLDMERDTRLINDAHGVLAAYAVHFTPNAALRFEAFAAVDPRFEGRGLGTAILDWAETQTRSRLQPGTSIPLWNSTPGSNAGAVRLFQVYGYASIRTFWQMTMDLDPSFDAGTPPPGVTIRSFDESSDAPAAFSALSAAFTTHFGYWEESFEDWWTHQQADETWDPTLGVVAEVDGTIVGASINGVIEGKGWIYELGVVPERQGMGIGRALLRDSFARIAARGIRIGRLGVDTENVTGALRLYRSIGMTPYREHQVFEKRIEAR